MAAKERTKSRSVEIMEMQCTCGCLPTCWVDQCVIHSSNYPPRWPTLGQWVLSGWLKVTIHRGCIIFNTSFDVSTCRGGGGHSSTHRVLMALRTYRHALLFNRRVHRPSEKRFVRDVLKFSHALCVCVCVCVLVCVFMCVHIPSLEVFHEVVASTLGSWGNSDPVNRGNGEDY